MSRLLFQIGVICCLVMVCVQSAYGQNGYVIRKDTSSYNVKIKDRGLILNSLSCVLSTEKGTIEYTPHQVIEFGFNNGKTYVAFDIQLNNEMKRVFLERVVRDKLSLYAYYASSEEKYYFAKGDTIQLKEILGNGKDERALFEEYVSDCAAARDNITYVENARNSLIRFVKNYNSCTDGALPRFRGGVILGLTATRLDPATNVGWSKIDFKNDWFFLAGGFIDQPIGITRLSFHPEVYYKRNSYSYAFKDQDIAKDMVINCASVNVPLLLRYTWPRRGARPYLLTGVVYSRLIKNQGSLYSYTTSGNNVHTEIDDTPLLDPNFSGFSFGIGRHKDVGNKYSWFIDGRYTQLFGLKKGDANFNLKEFTIRTGFIF